MTTAKVTFVQTVGSVKTAIQCAIRGINYIGAVKQNHSGFPKNYFDEHLKDAPGGCRIVMEGKHSVTGEKIIAIGYKYCSKKTLHYVATYNAGSTLPGHPYEMKFTDE